LIKLERTVRQCYIGE